MFNRLAWFAAMLILILAISCAPQDRSPEADVDPVGQDTTGQSDEIAEPPAPPVDDPHYLIEQGDFKGAIEMVEGRIAEGEQPEHIVDLIIRSHQGYINQIVMSRGVDPAVLNRVLFSHYSRILEFDPENEEAKMGIGGARAWFESHGMTVPSEVNPLDFLPEE